MKLNNLLLSLALVATGSVMVACGSGSSSNNGPAAPVVTQLTPPAGFGVPTGVSSPDGVVFNLTSGELAIPVGSTYQTLQMTEEQTMAVVDLMAESGTTVVIPQNGGAALVMGTSKIIALQPIQPTTNSTQDKSLKDGIKLQLSYYFLNLGFMIVQSGTPPKILPNNNLLISIKSETTNETMLSVIEPSQNRETSKIITIPNTKCTDGNISAYTAVNTSNVDYIALGTSTGQVCVYSGANLTETNLSSQAPVFNASTKPGGYKGGNVSNLGFPTSPNTGNNLVGYWTANNNIYKIGGSYVSGVPTGNSFYNTTFESAQTSNGQAVTFNYAPNPADVKATYVDNIGDVWTVTRSGSNTYIYVLRNGYTTWTSVNFAQSCADDSFSATATGSGAIYTCYLYGGSYIYSMQ